MVEELGGGVGAKVTAYAVRLCWFATHSDGQHIEAGGTFGTDSDSPLTPEGDLSNLLVYFTHNFTKNVATI